MTDREYNSCVSDHADGVYRFILKNLQHVEDARDVIQSAFEKMWINRSQVNVATAKSYLFTVAYNQMIDHIRKNKRIELREHFEDVLPGWHMSKKYWNTIILEGNIRWNDLKEWIDHSYDEVVKGLKKTERNKIK